MKKYKNVFALVSTIVATVVGAGFATGQEIYSFFATHGKYGLVGLMLVFVLFYICIESIMCFCLHGGVRGFSDFTQKLGMLTIAHLTEVGVAAFSFCGLCSMAAATGSLLEQSLHFPYMGGVLLLLTICAFVLLKDIQGLTRLNLFLAPVICVGLIFVCIRGVLFRSVQTFANPHYYAEVCLSLRDGILYVSYNFLSVTAVLCSAHALCKSEKDIRVATFAATGILTFLALGLYFLIGIYINKIQLGSLPIYDIVLRSSRGYEIVYICVLLFSVLTTAVGCGYAVLDFLKSRYRMRTSGALVLVLLAALPVCMLGFTDIVRRVYSFFGYMGLPLLGLSLVLRTKLRNNSKNKLKSRKLCKK